MIIYSVHIQIQPDIEQDWLSWMREVHIPEVIQHKGFINYQMIKMQNTQTCEYRIDYYIQSLQDYTEYQQKYAPELQKKHTERYQGKFTAHRTIGFVL